MTGWIKISRELPEHWIWQDSNRLKWWLDLLFMASWEDSKQLVGSRLVEIKRGQLVASISFLGKRWGINHNTVISFLKMLQDDKMITKSSKSNISIITICNFESYQAADNLSDKLNGYKSEQCTTIDNNTTDNLADNLADNRQAQNRTFNADNLADNLSDGLNAGSSMQYQSIFKSRTDNLSERSADSLADNPADTNKEIYNNNYNTSNTRTRESFESFRQQLLADTVFWEGAAMSQKVSIERLRDLLPDFINEKIALNELSESYTDFRRHFFSWARIAISKQARIQHNEAKQQDRYSKRRGADSEARSAEDYTGEI